MLIVYTVFYVFFKHYLINELLLTFTRVSDSPYKLIVLFLNCLFVAQAEVES